MIGLIIVISLLLVTVAVPIVVGAVLMKTNVSVSTGRILIITGVSIFLFFACLVALFMYLIASMHPVFMSVFTVLLSAIIIAFVVGVLWGYIKKRYYSIPLTILLCLCLAVPAGFFGHQSYIDSIPTVGEPYTLLDSYAPYGENTKVATLDEASTLLISEDIPRMNGATAMYPIYSAFARAVYPRYTIEENYENMDYGSKLDYFLACDTTTYAYSMIVDGDADIIFVGGPSEEQEIYAKENGVELVYTPIGKEAFVFFVNSQNPIDDISLDEIKGIYSGEITKWNELGVEDFGKIRAFQRDEGSGSQSALQRLMGDTQLMIPPKENVVSGMGGIIEQTADYKNYKNAIGYSFRFYSTEMVKNDQIKLLSINGVYPSLENIENGTYPIASTFFAVTRSDADENTKKLVEWILSPQGQELIEKTGYTPLN